MAKKKFVWHEPKSVPKPVIDMIIEKGGKMLLYKRDIYPFKGKYCVIGGFVEDGEAVEETALREVKEETGLKVKLTHILGVYSDKKRDPRFHTISTVFIGKVVGGRLRSSYEGKVEWVEIGKIDVNNMGFDHGTMVRDYIRWKRKKGTYWSTK
ncbi:MAG: NUDIX hydrolase [Candidatus Aenigmarchaeota archaeon]|nr:NUDIX hydrolase [Candidatus Aenigmarchaeota archaeon]